MATKKSSRASGGSASLSLTPKQTARAAKRELLTETIKSPEEVALSTQAKLDEFGLAAEQVVEVENPITHKKSKIVIRRDGTPESELITTLANPENTREAKDHALSMYFWGRGAESVSMMVELMRYRGQHTKETRVFKSQMRFDFEAFIDQMIGYLEGQAFRIEKTFGIELRNEASAYRDWLSLKNNKGRQHTYWDYVQASNRFGFDEARLPAVARLESLMISEAIFALDQAETLRRARENITKSREREKGKGIYVAPGGKIYSVDDPILDDIIKADRAATNEIEHD